MAGRILQTLVQHHDDVGPQRHLDFHRPLGREELRAAVEMRAEGHALLAQLANLVHGENLEAAAVGQQRALPAHEAVQAAQLTDGFVAGAQKQVVGVGQQKLRAQLLQHRLRQRLHRARRPHRHEHGRLHYAVGGVQPTHPRL